MVTNKMTKNIRLLSLKALHQINHEGAYANIIVQSTIQEERLSDQDRRFFTEIVYGVLRKLNYLDALLSHLMKKPIKSAWARNILRMGLYQIIYMDKVPPSAAINESVKLTKKMAKGLDPVINGVLRNYLRQKDKLSIEALSHSKEEKISYTYNQPLWLIRFWFTQYEPEDVISLCEHFNKIPKLYGRLNYLNASKDEILDALEKEQVIYSFHPYFPDVISIESHKGNLRTQEWFKKGYIAFMDAASTLIGQILHPEPGQAILDTCAAPGSKSLHIATLIGNNGTIKSCDIFEHKLDLLTKNAKRLGVTCITTALQDGRKLPSKDWESYDRVLVDAPCSGLGILQRKLDMRWRKEEKTLYQLPLLQFEILRAASDAVKKGGYLVYSTCTLNHLENEGVVEKFLKEHKDFTLCDASEYVSFPINGPMITIRPDKFDCDGFFIALLRKK